jgi:hypothetical protein
MIPYLQINEMPADGSSNSRMHLEYPLKKRVAYLLFSSTLSWQDD